MTTTNFQQAWGLDPVGNWATFDQDNDGTGGWDVGQTRTNNQVNEFTAITNTTPGGGSAWASPPAYDAAGGTTAFPMASRAIAELGRR